MYQLVLHTMAPVRMKITKTFFFGGGGAGPLQSQLFRYYFTLIFKHPFTYTLYAHAHNGTLQLCKNIYKLHGKSCPASLLK